MWLVVANPDVFCRESLFDNFSDLSIEFGYLAFFSPAFPLACVLAFFANLIDLRSDSLTICRGFRRVPWQHAEDIGSWYSVILMVSYLAVLFNACLLGFVSTQMAQGDEVINISNRFKSYTVWIGVIGFEHFVLSVKFALGFALADEPRWIDSATEELAYYRREKLLTVKQVHDKKILTEAQDKLAKEHTKLNEAALIGSKPKHNPRCVSFKSHESSIKTDDSSIEQ